MYIYCSKFREKESKVKQVARSQQRNIVSLYAPNPEHSLGTIFMYQIQMYYCLIIFESNQLFQHLVHSKLSYTPTCVSLIFFHSVAYSFLDKIFNYFIFHIHRYRSQILVKNKCNQFLITKVFRILDTCTKNCSLHSLQCNQRIYTLV